MTTLIRWLVIGDLNVADGSKEFREVTGRPREVILAKGETSPYHPSSINSIVLQALREARSRIDEISAAGQVLQNLQLCLRPVLEGEARPSFGLSTEAVKALAHMEVALDFDPY